MVSTGGIGYVNAYDFGAGAYKELHINGAPLLLNPSATASPVGVGGVNANYRLNVEYNEGGGAIDGLSIWNRAANGYAETLYGNNAAADAMRIGMGGTGVGPGEFGYLWINRVAPLTFGTSNSGAGEI